jgi:hypothetical protein
MTGLREINNQELLKELENRIHSNQLSKKELAEIIEAEE